MESPKIASATDLVDPVEWNKLWEHTHETRYGVVFEEFLLEELLRRWEKASYFTRIIVTITAPGSAISGWALWNTPGFRSAWAILAGLGALAAVCDAVFGISERIKEQTVLLTEVRGLRVDIESFQIAMDIKSLAGLKTYKSAFASLRDRVAKVTSKFRNDLLSTKRVHNIVQTRLNVIFPRP